MQNITLGQAKRESECSCRSCERVLFVVGRDRRVFENRRLTGLIRVVLNVLPEVESWIRKRIQVQDKDNHVTETDENNGDTKPVDKMVDVPG